jgi:hypothetical protein
VKQKPETRIIARKLPSGKTSIFVHEPQTGRTTATGLEAIPELVEKEILSLKHTLEAAGNYVTVVCQDVKD